MKNNNYALFYRTSKFSTWQSKRPDLPVEEWENYAQEQEYAEYDIKKLDNYDAFDLHLLTDIVYFDGNYYLPQEEIPYPVTGYKKVDSFDVSMELEEEDIDDAYYDEVYNKQDICRSWGYLWTDVITTFKLPDIEMEELWIIGEGFVKYFPEFLEKLERNNHAVYINDEYSSFKWLGWIKDNKIRLIHQDYSSQAVKNCFDILLDKDLFFQSCEIMLNKMQEYTDKNLKGYQDYALKKYGKLSNDSIPYPETEPLNLGQIEIKTEPKSNEESDLEDLYKTKDDLWTSVYTYWSLGDKTEEVVLIAEDFADRFPLFLQELNNIENAVYDDGKYTETKLHAWIKGDKVRLFYQDYSDEKQEVIFDVLVDKNWFFNTAEKLVKQMTELAITEYERYQNYLKMQRIKCQEEQ